MSTLQTVKGQIHNLIEKGNSTTGKTYTDLTSVVDSLIAGYGTGESEGSGESSGTVENLFQYATNLDYLFNYATFPTGYELVLNVPNFKETANRLVRGATGLKSVKLIGNNANNTISLQYAFNSLSSLETVDFSEWGNGGIKPTYANTCFNGSAKLHTINGYIDWSSAVNVNDAFGSCTALENVTFKENTLSKSLSLVNSPLLSDESIQSVIDGLTDLTGGTTQTITLHADVKAKLTEEQTASITAKNWTLA